MTILFDISERRKVRLASVSEYTTHALESIFKNYIDICKEIDVEKNDMVHNNRLKPFWSSDEKRHMQLLQDFKTMTYRLKNMLERKEIEVHYMEPDSEHETYPESFVQEVANSGTEKLNKKLLLELEPPLRQR